MLDDVYRELRRELCQRTRRALGLRLALALLLAFLASPLLDAYGRVGGALAEQVLWLLLALGIGVGLSWLSRPLDDQW